jgi:hypothetical protein
MDAHAMTDVCRTWSIRLLFIGLCICPADAAPKPKAAMMMFRADTPSFQEGNTARQFSDLLQMSLAGYEGIDWVERSDARTLRTELELSAAGWVESETRARAGHWAACDFLLFGRFETLAKPTPQLLIELIHPVRGELIGTLPLPWPNLSLTNKQSTFQELLRIKLACVEFLKEVTERHYGTNRIPSLSVIDHVHFHSIHAQPDLPVREISREFLDVLEQSTLPGQAIRIQPSTRPRQGRREVDLLSGGFVRGGSTAWTNSSAALLVALSSNQVSLSSSPTGTITREVFSLGVALLTASGRYLTLGATNLTAEKLPSVYRDLATKVLSQVSGMDVQTPVRDALPTASLSGPRLMADHLAKLTWDGGAPSTRLYDLAAPSIRRRWLRELQFIETACLLAPDDLELRRQQFRLRYLAGTGTSQEEDPEFLREMGDSWQQLVEDFMSSEGLTAATAARAIGWLSPDARRRLLNSHYRNLTLVRSPAMKHYPTDATAQFIQLAEQRLIDWAALISTADSGPEAALSLQTADYLCQLPQSIQRLSDLRRRIRPLQLARQAEEKQHRALLPRLTITNENTPEFNWERFYRVPNTLPAPTQVALEPLPFRRNPKVDRVVDLCWLEGNLWLLTQGQERRQLTQPKERGLEVDIEGVTLDSWRVWEYSLAERSYREVTGFETTNRFSRIFTRSNRVWLAGAKLVEIDATSRKALRTLLLPSRFSGVINQIAVQGSHLYVASSRGSASRFDFETAMWGSYPNLPPHFLWQSVTETAVASGGSLVFGEAEPMKLNPEGNAWLTLRYQSSAHPGRQIGPPTSIVPGPSNSLWIASSAGLFRCLPSGSFDAAWFTPAASVGNLPLDGLQASIEKSRGLLGESHHPALELNRFPGPIQKLIPDGAFLWVVCSSSDPGTGWICALLHQPTMRWIGHFAVPTAMGSDAKSIVLRDRTLWLGGTKWSPLGMLARVDCRSLYDRPQSEWTSLEIPREALLKDVARWAPHQRAFHHFLDADYPQVLNAIDEISPLDESFEIEWMGALASLASPVNQPERALRHLDTLQAWLPPGSGWTGIAETLRVDVGNRMHLNQFGKMSTPAVGTNSTAREAEVAWASPDLARSLYRRFDANADGRLGTAEVLSVPLDKDPFAGRLFVYDLNRNRKLDPEETLLHFGVLRARVQMLIAGRDKDHDGLIGITEAEPLFTPENPKPGYDFSQPNLGRTFAEAIRTLDENKDAKISAAEVAWDMARKATAAASEDPGLLTPEMIGGASSPDDLNGNGRWDLAEMEIKMKELRTYWASRVKPLPPEQTNARR